MNEFSVDSSVSDPPARTEEAWDATKTRAVRTLHEGETFVKANPVFIVLGGLAIGVLLGILMTRKEPTLRERYVTEPLDNLRGILSDVNARAARETGRGSDAATQAVRSLTGRIKRSLSFW
jgi:hypothetical protein